MDIANPINKNATFGVCAFRHAKLRWQTVKSFSIVIQQLART